MKPYYQDDAVTIYHGDCRDVRYRWAPSIIVTDPPYGVTDHAWDIVVPAVDWMQSSAAVAFASEPYATELINTSPLPFSYDLVWTKNTASNALNAARMPLRDHERILIFGKPVYNPMKTPRTADELARLNVQQRRRNPSKYSGTVLAFDAVNNRNSARTAHPSQKPIELMRWLITAYTKPGDLIIDPFMGSGTTLRAAKDLGRRGVGVELDERFCRIASDRMGQEVFDVAA